MYTLMIADDEKFVCAGLKNIIDWNSLGFEVVNLFYDGQEVIDALDSMIPDVILTDIRMVYASGLDVAKYVFENELPTKVVLLSGYQEFELARTGMRYGVVNYLLKPVKVEEIEKAFIKIKEDLDKEKQQNSRMEEAIPFLEEHFFTDLVLGGVTEREEFIKNRFELLYPELRPEACGCFLADFKIDNYKEFIEDNWDYTQDQLEENLRNFLKICNEEYVFHIVYKSGDLFELAGIRKNADIDRETCLLVLDKLKKELEENFLFSCQYHLWDCYASVYSLGENQILNTENKNTNLPVSRIEEQKKLMISNILMGNVNAAKKVFDSILAELNGIHIVERNNRIIDILAAMNEAIKNTNEGLYHSLSSYFDYSIILSAKDIKAIGDYCSRIFDRILMAKKKNEISDMDNLIMKAKSYIQEHICRDISQEEIAGRLFICPTYLSRLFKKETGENFSQYVTRVKMEKAVELLKDPSYKTYQVGEILGYKTPRYFSRLFRMQTGLNPSEYRKRILKAEGSFDGEKDEYKKLYQEL